MIATATWVKLVAYYRVSTAKQGKSGLGMEAQQAAVEAYRKSVDGRVIAPPFIEVESGKRKDRPQLAAALARAKALKATLVVAKLDRLARNVAFLSALIESGVPVVFADMPNADRFTVHILAAVAEKEAKDISDRTKAALAAYKARGGKLGADLPQCRNLTEAARKKGSAAGGLANAKAADEHLAGIVPIIRELRESGATLKAIADHLNSAGFTTRRGNPFSHVQVLLALQQSQQS